MTNDAQGVPLDIGADYLVGAQLAFDESGRSVLRLADGRALRIDPSTLMQVARIAANPAIANLAMGTHRITGLGDPVGLQDAATAAWSIGAFLLLAQNGNDIPSKPTFRTNIGLGNVATLNVGTTAGTAAAGDDARFLPTTEHTRLRLRHLLRAELGAPGWTSAADAGGSGTSWYWQYPEYESVARTNLHLLSMALDTGTAGSGTNARVARQSQSGRHWLTNEHRSLWQVFATNASAISVARFGWWGGGSAVTPGPTGRPTYGVWLESDAATHGDSAWRACAANGGTVEVAATGIAFDSTKRLWLPEFESTSSCKVWDLVTSSSTPRATLTTHLPNGTTAQACTPFGQILRNNGAGSNGKLWLPTVALVETDGGFGYSLPA